MKRWQLNLEKDHTAPWFGKSVLAADLPIACSQLGPMPEVLGEAGVYFDPERPEDNAQALRALLLDEKKREQVAVDAYQTATPFTWERCARETLGFIAKVANSSR